MKNNKLSTKFNSNAVLDRIKDHYGFRRSKQLANFFGVADTTLSSWYTRNRFRYEIVVEKCVEMDLNIMFRGKEYVVKTDLDTVNESEKKEYDAAELLQLIREKDTQISRMAEEIGKLKEQNRILKKQLSKE